jgi:hypothetical protein
MSVTALLAFEAPIAGPEGLEEEELLRLWRGIEGEGRAVFLGMARLLS